MAFFEWSQQYSVGIQRIDAQHQQLVAMVNSIYEAMSKGKGQEILGTLLEQLAAYTRTHFATEEALLAQHGYPGLGSHKAEHAWLIAQVGELVTQYRANETATVLDTATFLKGWLTTHILGTDRKYGPFLVSKGLK